MANLKIPLPSLNRERYRVLWYYSALQDTYTEVHVGWTDSTLSLYFFVLALIAVAIHTDEL